jgi:nucleotide-binding universal stress UspA family protein
MAADAIVVLDGPGRAAQLEALAGDMDAAVLALPYGRGPFDRAFGVGRLARRLASRCPAPVAVLPPGSISPASRRADA